MPHIIQIFKQKYSDLRKLWQNQHWPLICFYDLGGEEARNAFDISGINGGRSLYLVLYYRLLIGIQNSKKNMGISLPGNCAISGEILLEKAKFYHSHFSTLNLFADFVLICTHIEIYLVSLQSSGLQHFVSIKFSKIG